MSKPKIADKKEDLLPLKEGYVRVVHMTKTPHIESIRKNGLNYHHAGMLGGTSITYSKEEDVEYWRGDPRFSGPGTKAVVMDIPFKQAKMYERVFTSDPKIVSPKYIVGIIDVSNEKQPKINRLEKEAGKAMVFLGFIGLLLFYSLNLTGNIILNNSTTQLVVVPSCLFALEIIGVYIYIKKI